MAVIVLYPRTPILLGGEQPWDKFSTTKFSDMSDAFFES